MSVEKIVSFIPKQLNTTIFQDNNAKILYSLLCFEITNIYIKFSYWLLTVIISFSLYNILKYNLICDCTYNMPNTLNIILYYSY